jgi:hypothetical protein
MTVSKELDVRFSESVGGRMRGQWHPTCGRIHIFLRKEE